MHEHDYSAREELHRGARVILLRDEARDQNARVLMYAGNNLMELSVGGRDYMHFPEAPGDFARSRNLAGNPFLFPWGNRLRGDYYHFRGERFDLSPDEHNPWRDGGGLPLHGLVLKSTAWEPAVLEADENGALYRANLNWEKVPGGLENFPFPHRVETTHHLTGGRLVVRTAVHNTGTEAMPACFGHHPYFALPRDETGAPRSGTRMKIPAREFLTLSQRLLPTGETRPAAKLLGDPADFRPEELPLDHVFTNLHREADGLAWFRLETDDRVTRIGFDENYPIAVIYAPAGQPFVCVEPMTAPTDALNLAHEGAWEAPPTVEPGASFTAEFVIETD